MVEEPPAKRIKGGNGDDDAEVCNSDLTVMVEDEAFPVHYLLLVLVSPVFGRMLATNMTEKQQKTITLTGKKKSEFKAFWDIIQPMTTTTVTKENVCFLSIWANEYQVDTLKDRCETLMMAQIKVSVEGFQHAIAHNLPRRAEQCKDKISGDLLPHLDALYSISAASAPQILGPLWPSICNAAGVELHLMPGIDMVLKMFPFIAAGVRGGAACSKLETSKNSGMYGQQWKSLLKKDGAWVETAIDVAAPVDTAIDVAAPASSAPTRRGTWMPNGVFVPWCRRRPSWARPAWRDVHAGLCAVSSPRVQRARCRAQLANLQATLAQANDVRQ